MALLVGACITLVPRLARADCDSAETYYDGAVAASQKALAASTLSQRTRYDHIAKNELTQGKIALITCEQNNISVYGLNARALVDLTDGIVNLTTFQHVKDPDCKAFLMAVEKNDAAEGWVIGAFDVKNTFSQYEGLHANIDTLTQQLAGRLHLVAPDDPDSFLKQAEHDVEIAKITAEANCQYLKDYE
jgi:hypothetical protein